MQGFKGIRSRYTKAVERDVLFVSDTIKWFLRKFKRWKWIGITGGSLLLVLILLFQFTKVASVKVEGNVLYSEQEIKDCVMPGFWEKNAGILYVKDKLFGIELPSFVQEIELEWTGKRNLVIHTYEKAIIACVKYMNHYVYFDRDGIVLESTLEPLAQVPYVTGVDFGNFVLHQKIAVEDEEVFSIIMNLSRIISHLGMNIERIHIGTDSEVLLMTGDIQIKLGKQEMYDEVLTALSGVLDVAKEEGYKGEIDLSHYKSGTNITLTPEKEEKKVKKKKKKGE